MPLDDEDNFVSFGTPLDPIEEEEVARKKPMTIQDQVATDEKGRRRFHGAFTGGFSAGYFNTVGSKEGWTPSTFKSSRSDRFSTKGQNVTDYMDDEDMGAFGIAPQVLRPTDNFAGTGTASSEDKTSGSKKRTKPIQSEGPIPGVPVLHQIIEPVKETIGIKILVKMGWRPGQGVGPRITNKKKTRKSSKIKVSTGNGIEKPTIVEEMDIQNLTEAQPKRSYGCQLPPEFQRKDEDEGSSNSSDEEIDTDILYAPEDVDSPLCNPKENTFGLGYIGLERMTDSVGHIDLFGNPLKFRVDNKKLSITGEAFGIGAFEEPDVDVYNREDMTQYDFELETVEERRKRKVKEVQEKGRKNKTDSRCIAGFSVAKNGGFRRKYFPPPRLPHDFEPVHVNRKSRFEKTSSTSTDDGSAKRGLGRHALSIQERQVLLGEETSVPKLSENEQLIKIEPSDLTNNLKPTEIIGSKLPPEQDPSIIERVERIKKFVQVLQAHSVPSQPTDDKPVFKPFIKNPEKQDRYEKYQTLVAAGFQDSLKDIQPPQLTEWEREREKQEFERAAEIYKPLSGIMQSRFVSAKSHDISHIIPEKEITKEKDPTEDPKVAARMNLFGKLTHIVLEWHPDKLLCKRFNIKDPYPDSKFVGLRGGPSTMKRESSTQLVDQLLQTEAPNAPILPKKSLFDNLDFSKPPPGLQPLDKSPNSEPPPPGTIDETPQANVVQTKSLEFQTNLPPATTEEKENYLPSKPPLDLFKEIFADSSSESEDDETNLVNEQPTKRTTLLGKIVSDSKPSKHERDDSRRDKLLSLDQRRFDREDNTIKDKEKEAEKKDCGRRGIFDNIDFTKLNKSSNEVASSKAGKESEDEEDAGLYGPRAPIKPLSSSTFQNSKSQVPSTHPRFNILSSSIGISSFSGSSLVNKKNDNDVVWVEKEKISDSSSRSKSKKHSIKKSKKSKSKKAKHKDKSKHKKSKKHKSKKSKTNKFQSSGHSDSTSNSSDEDEQHKKDDSDDSSSSIKIHGSLNQKSLLEQLKNISRSH